MAKRLVYYVAVTLDGFIARRDGSFDGFLFEGEHFADLARDYPETFPVHYRALVGASSVPRRFDTVLMGRNTYEVGLREGITDPYLPLRQIVVSRTMAVSPSPTVELWGGDPVELVRRLKAEDGRDVWLCGGAKLAGALVAEIDELILKVNPVLFGEGTPLFAGFAGTLRMAVLERKAYSNGFELARYAPVR